MWSAVLVAAAGCYAIKLAGLSIPQRVLEGARVRRMADLLPVALLAALVATQALTTGQRLVVDARAAGVAVAIAAVLLRAPFIVVVAAAAAATAGLRALG